MSTGGRAPRAGARAAIFLDRDGTIIADAHYVHRPEDVALLPDAASAIAQLNAAAMPVIVISNQSGIGRGYLSMADYERVRARVDELLAAAGARIDATYICPHAPAVPPCACRKPGTALHLQAAAEHDIDVARSWYVGDRWRDVAPAATLGGHGILVPGPDTPAEESARATATMDVAPTLGAAVRRVLAAGADGARPRTPA